MRIESDDEETNHQRVAKKACLSDEDSCDSSLLSHMSNTTKFDPEMIERLLDTYSDLYPTIDKMVRFGNF